MSKGYDRALRDAGGDPSKVKSNYGWYSTDSPHREYDDDGKPVPYSF